VFGLIAVAGAKIWVDNRVDFSQNKNLIVAAITLILGTGDFTLKFGQFALGGIGTATFGAILLYAGTHPRLRGAAAESATCARAVVHRHPYSGVGASWSAPARLNAFEPTFSMADASAARTKAVFESQERNAAADRGHPQDGDLECWRRRSTPSWQTRPTSSNRSRWSSISQLAGRGPGADAEIDFTALRGLLARHQTQPVAVRGGSNAQNIAARAAGLRHRHAGRPTPRPGQRRRRSR
jgi:hypothetical protein